VTNVPGADDIKDRLKLPGKDIECLTSVLERFKHDAATPHTFQLDDIPKKGAGKSFLLHGKLPLGLSPLLLRVYRTTRNG
jgi:hypothetical protein